MHCQSLLRKGCVRRIGDGIGTKIWAHPGLPDGDNLFIILEISHHHGDATVSGLIDPITRYWDV